METSTVTSPKFELNKKDLTHILKVAAYAGVSAALGFVIASIDQINIPMQYAFIVPMVNVVLVSLQRYLSSAK